MPSRSPEGRPVRATTTRTPTRGSPHFERSHAPLVMLGELDEMFIQPAKLLVKELPKAEHVVVPGCGHMLAIEDPKGTADTLIGFLRSLG